VRSPRERRAGKHVLSARSARVDSRYQVRGGSNTEHPGHLGIVWLCGIDAGVAFGRVFVLALPREFNASPPEPPYPGVRGEAAASLPVEALVYQPAAVLQGHLLWRCGMRRLGVCVLVACLPAGGIFAQTLDPAVRKAKEARDAARRAGDAQLWGRYTADDFLVTQTDGAVNTKAERMTQIRGNKIAAAAPKVSDEQVRVYGNMTILTWREDAANGATRFTEVWVKEGAEWKVTAAQLTTVSKP
jgi:Domain of unknown function (DUF4440)